MSAPRRRHPDVIVTRRTRSDVPAARLSAKARRNYRSRRNDRSGGTDSRFNGGFGLLRHAAAPITTAGRATTRAVGNRARQAVQDGAHVVDAVKNDAVDDLAMDVLDKAFSIGKMVNANMHRAPADPSRFTHEFNGPRTPVPARVLAPEFHAPQQPVPVPFPAVKQPPVVAPANVPTVNPFHHGSSYEV